MSLKLVWDEVLENVIDPDFCDKDFTFEGDISSVNTLIKYENLQVLKWMVKKENLLGKVDLIYIDPPYNTGGNFTYKDDFSVKKDYHSAWLSFMNRRISLAKKLLSPSGCIFIAIGQDELFALKLLCDGIFGENNFVNDFMWLHGKGKKDSWSRTLQQHTLCYASDKTRLLPFEDFEESAWARNNLDGDSRGNWFSGSISFSEKRSNPNHKNYYSVTSPGGKIWTRQWLVAREEMQSLIAENKIYWGSSPNYSQVPREKIFNGTRKKIIPKNIIDCTQSTRDAQNYLDALLGEKGVFDNPKPVSLIKHFIKITRQKKDAIILDFFAGSGTTFEAVCELNREENVSRRCILVQKCEHCQSKKFFDIASLCQRRCQIVSEKFNEKIQVISGSL